MKNEQTKKLSEILIELAQAKIEAQKIADAQAKKITERETEERFTLFFGRKPERVSGNKAFFENFVGTYNCGYRTGWNISLVCSKCRKNEINLGYGDSLEAVGELLAKGIEECVNCRPKSTPVIQSAEDKLCEALIELIQENSSCSCD